MECAGAFLQIGKMVLAPVGNVWKYHRGLDRYMSSLDEKSEELNARKEDVQLKLRAELLPGNTTKKEVELWLGRVEKINAEIQGVKEEYRKQKYFSRSWLGRVMFQKTKEVDRLYEKGVFPNSLVEALPQCGDILPTTALGGETTFKKNMEEIWACLMNDEVRKIGVYGMGGIGKTTALKHINNRLIKERQKFDRIIWVTVSQVREDLKLQDAIRRLQDEIAHSLSLDLSPYRNERRAAKLYEALSKTKKHVLILDDLWEAYCLEDVGIPEPTLENGCKLVLTTRSFDVCRGMSCKSIRMELLSNSETRKLFLDIVGRGVLSVPNLELVMAEVIKECGHLPLAIKTIAGSLKGSFDCNEWHIALAELKAFTSVTGSTVLEHLKFSYERLSNKKLKDCLLYCALYPEDYDIVRSELIEYMIVEGIVGEMETRQAQVEMGHTMLNKLENACLLEGSSNESGKKCVKMHDLVRDMALQITSCNARFLVLPTVGSTRMPSEANWTADLLRVSFIHSTISYVRFSASPRCPMLSTLLMNRSRGLEFIPDCFFIHMVELNVLDLSYTRINTLPKSVSNLVNLTALLVRGCLELRTVPSLANLKALKRLDLWGTGITEVPQGMEKLVNLRSLDLYAANLSILPLGILPKLSLLQCLILHRYPSTRVAVRGDELASLTKLETFVGIFQDVDNFNTYVKSLELGVLTNYILQLGFSERTVCGPRGDSRYKYKRVVVLKNWDMNECIAGDYPVLLPKDVEQILIARCYNVRSFCRIASLKNAKGLKCCIISSCDDIEYVLSSSSSAIPFLQSLEELDLTQLLSFRGLMSRLGNSSPLFPPMVFYSLRKLSIQFCPEIKYLLTPVLLQCLRNLEAISVKHCGQMEEIVCAGSDQIEEGSHDSADFLLPKLMLLELWDLPNLKSICSYRKAVVAESLQTISISQCPKLSINFALPTVDEKLSPPPLLQTIKVDKEWWEALQWEHPEARDVLQPLCEFWEDGWSKFW